MPYSLVDQLIEETLELRKTPEQRQTEKAKEKLKEHLEAGGRQKIEDYIKRKQRKNSDVDNQT